MSRRPSHGRGPRRLRAAGGSFPRIEITDAGLYVRFKNSAGSFRTIVKRTWPHLAVDVDRRGRVVGIELVPLPARFALREIAARAGMRLPSKLALRAQVIVPPGLIRPPAAWLDRG